MHETTTHMLVFAVHPVAPVAQPASSQATTCVAIIPARYNSTRLPGKPLLNINGLTMIEHVYRRTQQAESVSRVLVATDDERIVDTVIRFGGNACLTRPEHTCGSDRLAEVAATMTCEIVVNVQGDEPLIEPSLIDAVLAPLVDEPTITIATARCPITDPAELASPHVVKVVVDRRGEALYFSRAPLPTHQLPLAHTDAVLGYKHIGLYAYRRKTLLELARLGPTPLEQCEQLEQLRALESGYRIATIETDADPVGVDTAQDLERVRRLVSNRTVE